MYLYVTQINYSLGTITVLLQCSWMNLKCPYLSFAPYILWLIYIYRLNHMLYLIIFIVLAFCLYQWNVVVTLPLTPENYRILNRHYETMNLDELYIRWQFLNSVEKGILKCLDGSNGTMLSLLFHFSKFPFFWP